MTPPRIIVGLVVQPIGRAHDAPHLDLLLIATISMRLVGQNYQRVVQTRRIHLNLVVADPFEHQDDFLHGGKHEVCDFSILAPYAVTCVQHRYFVAGPYPASTMPSDPGSATRPSATAAPP